MQILVQKFGGTSVANQEIRAAAVLHVESALSQGYQVVVVVSAMGRRGDPYATDTLLELLRSEDGESLRDKDILMSCGEALSAVVFAGTLRSYGHAVTVLSGGQAGIYTSDRFGDARILEIRPQRIISELEKGRVVVVMGFQGVNETGDVTTLGRGGSDTTATALAVALNAQRVDIFTDVDGIMTADPKIVDEARKLKRVTYTEICNLAYQGAKVIHPRAVEIAMQKNVPIRVRSTQSMDEGTLVTSTTSVLETATVADRFLTGVTQTAPVSQISVRQEELRGINVFALMAEHAISVDFISVGTERVTYTVLGKDSQKATQLIQDKGIQPQLVENCAKVAAVGAGIAGVPGIMAKIVESLQNEDIEILQSADSHTTIWCLVHGEQMEKAVRALHRAFELDNPL
ncbi:aspartate kinase [Alicyclobacillaceae bacterium I2511]|nr:aspartate kinase [Alicyclobacillaceae bacterium I2511]